MANHGKDFLKMILDNGILHVEISEKGAEMVSLSKHGVQYLWNADVNYWNRHAPILFPIVGRLCEDKYSWGDCEYTMKQHGFARDSRFVATGNRGEMRLAEKPSKDVYPFNFDLSVCTLCGRSKDHLPNPRSKNFPPTFF